MALTRLEQIEVDQLCGHVRELEQQDLVALVVDLMTFRPDIIPVVQALIDG